MRATRDIAAYKVIIVGSGFGGQCAALALRRRGLNDFRILERRDYMGGTWCQNAYPGAAVDVHSPLYSIAEEPYEWTQMYADQAELEQYTNYVINKHGLRDVTDLSTNVEGATWNEDTCRWTIRTTGARDYRAQFVINASGPLSNPLIPEFEGLDRFEGTSFHTNGWDPNCDYRGKRVAVIGSGASAAQVIPAIAPEVEELHVFQRTPHWVVPRHDRVFSKIERFILRSDAAKRVLRTLIYWKLESRVLGFKYSKRLLGIVGARPALKQLKQQVADPALRAKLTPDYTIGCKRILISSTLFPALTRDNSTLHTKDDAIDEFTRTGVRTKMGTNLELDLVVFATGYQTTDGMIPYEIRGIGGQSLADFWDDFPRAYLGTAMPGFPNMFIVTGPNTGIGHTSALFIIQSQMSYITRSIVETDSRSADAILVRPEAEDRYTRGIHRSMVRTVWHSGGCNSWYKSKSGHVIAMFPGFSFVYRFLTGRFRPADHEFRVAS